MASLIAGGKVAGSGDTGLGVAPAATVDVVKVADAAGNTSLAAVLAGLNWVATHSDQVDVANLSLSVDAPLARYGIDPLNFAVSLTRFSGVTVVVAAGNTPGVVGDPGFGPDSLTVGAADTTGTTPSVASFSGYDNVDGMTKPDVVAAGVNVLGAMPTDSVISQQFPNARQADGLFRGSGTSQSTAIVTGLAALYLQAHHSAGPNEVKSAIRGAASSIAERAQGRPGPRRHPDRPRLERQHRRPQPERRSVAVDRAALGRRVLRGHLRRTPMGRPPLGRPTPSTRVVGAASPGTRAVGQRRRLRRPPLGGRRLRRPPLGQPRVGQRAGWGSRAWGGASWGDAA